MRIEVTAADIAAGKRMDPLYCPVALALSRAAGFEAMVCPDRAWRRDGSRPGVPLPPAARVFIRRFDERQPVGPFSFEVPDGLLGPRGS